MHYSGILCNGISHCIAAWSDLMENCIGCCLVVYIFCVIYRSLIDSHHSCFLAVGVIIVLVSRRMHVECFVDISSQTWWYRVGGVA